MVAYGANAVRLFGVAVDPEFLEIFDLPFVAGDARSALVVPAQRRAHARVRRATLRLRRSDRQDDRDRQHGRHHGHRRDRRDPGAVAVRPLDQRAAAVRLAHVARRVRCGSPSRFGLPPGARPPPGAGWFMLDTFTYLYLPATAGAVGRFACSPARRLRRASRAARRCCATRSYTFGLEPVRQDARRHARLLRHGPVVRGRAARARRPRARRRVRELCESRDRARGAPRARDRRTQGARRIAGADRGAELVRGRGLHARRAGCRARGVRARATAREGSARRELRRRSFSRGSTCGRRSARSWSPSRSRPARIPRSCCRACVP